MIWTDFHHKLRGKPLQKLEIMNMEHGTWYMVNLNMDNLPHISKLVMEVIDNMVHIFGI